MNDFSDGTLLETSRLHSTDAAAKKGDKNMLISTVVAVALGLTPVQGSGRAELVTGDYAAKVGRFAHFVDRRGTTHVHGLDRQGMPYELVMDKYGNVRASVADRDVSFRVREAV